MQPRDAGGIVISAKAVSGHSTRSHFLSNRIASGLPKITGHYPDSPRRIRGFWLDHKLKRHGKTGTNCRHQRFRAVCQLWTTTKGMVSMRFGVVTNRKRWPSAVAT